MMVLFALMLIVTLHSQRRTMGMGARDKRIALRETFERGYRGGREGRRYIHNITRDTC